jgi:hypothetical protein
MPPRTDTRKGNLDDEDEKRKSDTGGRPIETQLSPSSGGDGGGGGGGDKSPRTDRGSERHDSDGGTNSADRSERPSLQPLSDNRNHTPGAKKEQNQTPADANATGKDGNPKKVDGPTSQPKDGGQSYTPGPKKEQNQTPADANATGKDGYPKKIDGPSSKDKPPDGTKPDGSKHEKAPDKPSHPGKVSFANPLGDHKYHPGRGATGPGGHGADKGSGREWQSRSAQDIHAKPGTAVYSPVTGKVTEVHRDQRDQKTGKVYGDQVTITTPNGEMKVFMTHMNANQDIQVGKDVKQGEQIGKVSQWDSNPGGEHLHVGMAVAGQDGSYQGADPQGALDATRGTGQAKDVDVPGDGSYAIGDGASKVEYRPNDDTAAPPSAQTRPNDQDDYPGTRGIRQY